MSSYGAIPDTLTVGGTEDTSSLTQTDNVAIALRTNSSGQPVDGSGHGSEWVLLHPPYTAQNRMVDLATNYCANLVAASGTSSYDDRCGTSYSAPIVAGVAGLLLDWIHDRGGYGGWENDPYVLRTMLSLMGDGQSKYNSGARAWIDDSFGFGSLRFINFDNELGANGGMGIKRGTMYQGNVYEWGVGDGVPNYTSTGWKMIGLVDDNYYNDSPQMRYELIDKCPPGGGEQVVLTAASYALKARLRIPEYRAPSEIHGRCLYVRATVVAASGPVDVYFGDYFYSNARINHAVD